MKNKCYSIIRVSSEKQSKNTSLQHQKESIKNYCKYHKIELIDTIEEVFTGTTQNRDSLNTIRELVLNDECDSIIVMKLDRLMRSFSEGVVFIKFLIDNDVKIISVDEELNTDSISGKFYINLLLSLSELDRNTICERLSVGKMNNFNNNKRHSGRICFGYSKSENGLVVNEEESKIVRYIFKKYCELNRLDISKTMKTQKLLKLLKKNNFKYRGKDFQSYHIRQILQNEFYVGVMSHKNDKKQHSYDTIISKRLFNVIN